jgi:hypothetical protein
VAHYSFVGSDRYYKGRLKANLSFGGQNTERYQLEIKYDEPSEGAELPPPRLTVDRQVLQNVRLMFGCLLLWAVMIKTLMLYSK